MTNLELLYESRFTTIRPSLINSILNAEKNKNYSVIEGYVKALNEYEKQHLVEEGFLDRMQEVIEEAPQFWGGLKNAFSGLKQNYQAGKQQQAQKNLINQINQYMQNGQKLFSQLPTVFPNDVEMQKFVKYIGQWVTNLNAHAMPQPQQPVAPSPTQQQSTPPPIPTTQTPRTRKPVQKKVP